jgi:hypothetical protein
VALFVVPAAVACLAAAVLAAASIQATEGVNFSGQVGTVGGCTSGAAVINWGDSTTSTGTISGGGVVSGSHTYVEEGALTGQFNWTCGLDHGTGTFAVTVSDAPLSATPTVLRGTAGQDFTATVATFTDADPDGTTSDYTAAIDWGDGSASSVGTISAGVGDFSVAGSHTYAAVGGYPVTVTIIDGGGAGTSAVSSAFVLVPPTVTTAAASGVTLSAATLNGTVNPNGAAVTLCEFQWGTTTSYGSTATCAENVGSGTSPVPVTAVLSGLSPNTTYHFQLTARTDGGADAGSDQTFTTASTGAPTPPAVSPSPPSGVSQTAATFNGAVNPEGLATSAHFEYGLDPRYTPGGGAVVYDQSTPVQQVGSDSVAHPVSATLTGLLPNALYHVRLRATNSVGTDVGPDETFMTLADPAPPPPTLGKTINAVPVAGVVFVKPPPGKSLGPVADVSKRGFVKGHGFVPLTEARQLPSGSQIDARAGSLQMVTAAATRTGKLQTGVFGGALFSASQARAGLDKGLTTLHLLEGVFAGAPSYSSCPRAASEPGAAAAKVSSRVLQTLHASDRGRFRTRGHFSYGTPRGTTWDTIDRCDGTLTVVHRGTVAVFDFGRRKTIIVHAGQSYLASATKLRKH